MAGNLPSLPQFQGGDASFQLLQNSWGSILGALLRRPANNSIILHNVALASGANVVNHLLGRKLQGWSIVRLRASATIYDTQETCPSPELTLQLTASAPAVVDILVF